MPLIFFFFSLAQDSPKAMQKPPGLHGCLRCIHPTPLPPCFTWGQMASVLRLSSLLWLPVNLLPYKHSPPSPVCPFHLILASASRRIRFICGLNEAHSLGLRHRPTPHPHPMDPSQNTEDTSQDKQPQQVTHFKKLFIEFNFQKHRHLRQFCKDPEFLQGCFGYSKKKKKKKGTRKNQPHAHTHQVDPAHSKVSSRADSSERHWPATGWGLPSSGSQLSEGPVQGVHGPIVVIPAEEPAHERGGLEALLHHGDWGPPVTISWVRLDVALGCRHTGRRILSVSTTKESWFHVYSGCGPTAPNTQPLPWTPPFLKGNDNHVTPSLPRP